MQAADHELTGYRWHPDIPAEQERPAADASSSPPN
jgi:hypothetical protein